MSEFFEVKESTMFGAGKGLFALKDFKKGDILLEYTGQELTKEERKAYRQNLYGDHSYLFEFHSRRIIDGAKPPLGLGRFANDGRGGHIKHRNNCEFRIINKKAFFVATRKIKAGDEVLLNYGDDFWPKPKRNIKMKWTIGEPVFADSLTPEDVKELEGIMLGRDDRSFQPAQQ